jgi:hypothetical protein
MNIGMNARALAMASMLALAATGIPAVQAYAKANTHPQPKNLCAATDGHGNYEFYVPGAVVKLGDGHRYKCGADGEWVQVDLMEAPPTDTTGSPVPWLPTNLAPSA